MKIYIVVLLLAIFFYTDTTSTATAAHSPRPIVADTTAYYKPVKGQRRYVTGSYQGDIHLNGTGITYSGKRARIGYLAADLTYHPVGTKFRVFIDGKSFGIWTVEDKGGAIKNRHRFDFFVGESDAGRIAAESWGRGSDKTIVMYRI